MTMQLSFLGATSTVTGSKYLITVGSKKILVDCGLFQGYKELRLRNWTTLPVDPHSIDAVLLTHAHIDHSGYLPLLVKNGFTGKIYCTQGTRDLCAILLPDSGHIQEEDARHANVHGYSKHKPALPLYTVGDAIRTLGQFVPLDFNKKYDLFDLFNFEFLPAGHIIGSSIIRLSAEGRTLVFTGDLGRPHDDLMKPPALLTAADYLVLESTYGNRLHGQMSPLEQLATIIPRTLARGGSVIIPAFAVGRTQDILYYLYTLNNQKRIPDVPIFLDSPMAENASDLMSHYASEQRLSKSLCKAVCQVARYIRTPEESKAIDQYSFPVIIIAASGMLEGGRILHHLRVFLPNHLNTILLTGFQASGSRGESLLGKKPAIKIHGEMIPVRAEVIEIQNLSAHADYQEMLDWLKSFKRAPLKVFLTHGERESAAFLKIKIEETYGWHCIIPDYLQTEKL